MASFYGHFSAGVVVAGAYGAAGAWFLHYDWGVVFLATGLTVIGALIPDLDSDSGRPIRELFGLAGAVLPLFLIPRLRRSGVTLEQALCIMIGAYLFIRYFLSGILKRFSVHRGMFHSIPAMLIAGLAVYNVYHHEDVFLRYYMSAGMMIGFFIHLLLDEFCSVDLNGVPRLKSSFGTAIKFTSPSLKATAFCYLILIVLAGAAWLDEREDPRRAEMRGGRQPVGQAKQRF